MSPSIGENATVCFRNRGILFGGVRILRAIGYSILWSILGCPYLWQLPTKSVEQMHLPSATSEKLRVRTILSCHVLYHQMSPWMLVNIPGDGLHSGLQRGFEQPSKHPFLATLQIPTYQGRHRCRPPYIHQVVRSCPNMPGLVRSYTRPSMMTQMLSRELCLAT